MEDINIDAYRGFQATNNFIYKNKHYPINIAIFNCFSQYFTSKQLQLQPNSDIKLLEDAEDDINMTEESINDFISHCHNQRIYLTQKNVPALYKLSKKYIVPSLIESTEDFINKHKTDFAIEYLIMNQNQQNFKPEEYEEMIINSIQDYIDDNRLFTLPISSLHRILNGYLLKHLNSIKPSKLFEFLFKCLDKFGKAASVLFEHVDFGDAAGEVIKKLVDEYSEKFDFHFINENQLKTVYMLQSSLIEREEQIRQKQEEMKQEISNFVRQQKERNREKDEQIQQKHEEMANEIEQMRQLIQQMMGQQEDRNREKDAQIQQKHEEMANEISNFVRQQEDRNREKDEQIRQKHEEMRAEISQMRQLIQQIQSEVRDEIGRISQQCNEQLRQLREDLTRQSNSFRDQIDELNRQVDDVKNRPVSCRFASESDTSGAISLLKSGVALTGGGSIKSNYPLDNIRAYNDNYFYNYNDSDPQSESDSYIKFDFGPSKKIDLHSYFIRSNGGGESYSHPKTWRIEGSNDGSQWTRLDWRDDDQNLRGRYKQHHFVCKNQEHGGENNRYRYIRYVQADSWDIICKYFIHITYFELYGDIYG